MICSQQNRNKGNWKDNTQKLGLINKSITVHNKIEIREIGKIILKNWA